MASIKFAISVPEDVMRRVDRAAAKRGVTRSRFIADVLRRVAGASSEAEIARRIDAVFAHPEIRQEQEETARDFGRAAPAAGRRW